ncbi:hypothetical protein HPG69_008143 [Diceros bicornis minor]|uniref:Uncharacterized protein n=1 Tax=Diceros bicornis minor TaxID=77932 RepID=A0A7J7F6U8_DICBM|nr:hypothetical protein HPG69_008143 [Diceros bicornis minor]
MSCPLLRPENGRHPRTPTLNNSRIHTTRIILQTMLRNLRVKSQLHTHCSRISRIKIF